MLVSHSSTFTSWDKLGRQVAAKYSSFVNQWDGKTPLSWTSVAGMSALILLVAALIKQAPIKGRT